MILAEFIWSSDLQCVCVCLSFSHVRLYVTPGTIAHQAPLFMEFSRQEYWSGLPFPSPGDLLNITLILTKHGQAPKHFFRVGKICSSGNIYLFSANGRGRMVSMSWRRESS